MSQLKMYWLAGTAVPEASMPDGYSLSHYAGPQDQLPWVKCCRNGLAGPNDGTEKFENEILRHADLIPEEDVLFLDHAGEHVATITAVYHPERQIGEVHMVAVREDYRGKGLAKVINAAAVQKLAREKGLKYIYLTTNAWRKAAVKSYLQAGFLPVDYAEGDMLDRWKEALACIDVKESPFVNEQGEICGSIHAYDHESRQRIRNQGKVRVGVFGAGRGNTMSDFCRQTGEAELVAICDGFAPALENARRHYGDSLHYYTDFDQFLQEDMDMVVLANYANEHAPYAIRCLKAGKHVLSEVLPVETMQQAVELIETIEETGLVYGYAENYCYMNAPREMRRMYREGKLGTFEYGEGEYMHNCEPGWAGLTHGGNPEHWRNTMYSTYYCTHSIGPLIHITGRRPVSVSGFEVPFDQRMKRMGAKAGPIGVEMITLDSGALLKSVHGVGPARNSIWYSIYGEKGRMESPREDAGMGAAQKVYINVDDMPTMLVEPTDEAARQSGIQGHGGSDYHTMHHFLAKLRGEEDAQIVDVYEALDMFLPGMFAYRSILAGNQPQRIPDLRDQRQRDAWRGDTFCTNSSIAGNQLAPSYGKGNPAIPAENYEKLHQAYEARQKERSRK